ncbi:MULTISPECIES: hypothetical protein [unclassified Streptomyces]|uniref:hypothetical protein n=1 Tax=unclassified Streptomyces TaxID=2593676 RepID=UPI0037227DE0
MGSLPALILRHDGFAMVVGGPTAVLDLRTPGIDARVLAVADHGTWLSPKP